jgi:23S rRNA (adenine2503-C2)-methyltransferase
MIKNIGSFKDQTDGTIKSVFEINNSKIIEMSMLYNKLDKDVICVPTHHYCNLGCKMCHLTNNKTNKPMQKIKITDFMYCIIDTIKKYKTNKKKLLISFMGVGEPLLNLELIENVFKEENKIKELGYDYISYAISTMMPNNNLLKLKNMINELNMPIKVHFSLHTPIDKNRKELIPSTNVTIEEALNMLLIYSYNVKQNKIIMDNYKLFHSNNIPIEIHYTLIKNKNDSNKELKEIIKLLHIYQIPIKFIKFNPINNLDISNNEEKWVSEIHKNIPSLRIKTYSPPGREVGSSCGEFTQHYYLEELETKEELQEFNIWYKKHLIKN